MRSDETPARKISRSVAFNMTSSPGTSGTPRTRSASVVRATSSAVTCKTSMGDMMRVYHGSVAVKLMGTIGARS